MWMSNAKTLLNSVLAVVSYPPSNDVCRPSIYMKDAFFFFNLLFILCFNLMLTCNNIGLVSVACAVFGMNSRDSCSTHPTISQVGSVNDSNS